MRSEIATSVSGRTVAPMPKRARDESATAAGSSTENNKSAAARAPTNDELEEALLDLCARRGAEKTC